MSHIETSDKEILKRYHTKLTMQESTPDDLYCWYHIPAIKKIQCGRFFFCPECRGKPKLTSGKTIR